MRDNARGKRVRSLEYDAYPEMAEQRDGDIAAEVARRWPESALAMVHRVGPAGDRRVQRGGRRRLPAPRRGLRGLPLRDRYPQGERADLEERNHEDGEEWVEG